MISISDFFNDCKVIKSYLYNKKSPGFLISFTEFLGSFHGTLTELSPSQHQNATKMLQNRYEFNTNLNWLPGRFYWRKRSLFLLNDSCLNSLKPIITKLLKIVI